MTVIPKKYQLISDNSFESEWKKFISELSTQKFEDGLDKIEEYCEENNVSISLTVDNQVFSFGGVSNIKSNKSVCYGSDVVFTDVTSGCVIMISCNSKASNDILALFIKILPAMLVGIIIFSGFCAYICTKMIVSPIVKISHISRKMTKLDLTWKCDVNRSDEIGILSSNLNKMSSQLNKTMKELEEVNSQLRDDVEKAKELEAQRRNFFAAVSHELKTPLTILKGQLENMLYGYGDYQNHDKYLPLALKTTDDMEFLIKEIISITKMESTSIQDTLEEVSLNNIIISQLREVSSIADGKKIEIINEVEDNIFLSVNVNLFRKALSNILGNAVIHSPDYAKVFIRAIEKEGKQTMFIENTGANISESDLSQMFIPFYRVDKSRNKTTGGSGLGLYIVKTILDLHGMSYSIYNTEIGVAFMIRLT